MDTNNIIAKTLFIIGVLEIISGVIIGIVLGNIEVSGLYSDYNEFSWSIFLLWVIGGIVSGMLFLGFSEVIKLLDRMSNLNQEIKYKLESIRYEVKDDKNED